MSGLEQLLGTTELVLLTVAGRSLEVRPVTLRQLGPFTRALRELAGVDLGDVLSIAGHTEQVVAAVQSATGLDESWLWELSPEDLVTLAGTVARVNAGFFARSLLPAITRTLEGVTAEMGGATSSPAS